MSRLRCGIIAIFVALLTIFTLIPVTAQGYPRVQCGDVITGEFTANEQYLDYVIALQPGDTIQVDANRFGDYLTFNLYRSIVAAPSKSEVTNAGSYGFAGTITMKTGVLGERGDYIIQFLNYNAFGAFTFSITCTRNGEIYNANQPVPTSAPNLVPQPTSVAASFGYPGLPAIDFSGVSLISLIPDVPITSTIKPDGAGVSGFSFEAKTGDILSISATRLKGNFGVGFVVFSDPNIPVFIAGPISATTFATEITLPQDGKYVIGLFRMGDVPTGATSTDFQVTASVHQ